MNVVLTGGAGFIGRQLTKILMESSIKVTVVDNLLWGQKPVQCDNYLCSDISNSEWVEKLIKCDIDVIIHMAAYSFIPDCENNINLAIKYNILPIENVLKIAQNNGAKIIFISSAAVYANSSEIHQESEICLPDSLYGMMKYIVEKRIEQYCRSTNTSGCILRLTNVYGENDLIKHIIPTILKQVNANHTDIHLGNLNSKRDYIYLNDVTDIIVEKLSGKSLFEIINVASGSTYSANDIIHILSEIYHIKFNIISETSKCRKNEANIIALSINKLLQFYKKPLHSLKDGLTEMCHSAQQ
jgi:nucleoside-diphosphate-sugar epimerase